MVRIEQSAEMSFTVRTERGFRSGLKRAQKVLSQSGLSRESGKACHRQD